MRERHIKPCGQTFYESVLQCYIKIVQMWNVFFYFLFIYYRVLSSYFLASLNVSGYDCLTCSQILNDSSECLSVSFWVCIFFILKLMLQAGRNEHDQVLSTAL